MYFYLMRGLTSMAGYRSSKRPTVGSTMRDRSLSVLLTLLLLHLGPAVPQEVQQYSVAFSIAEDAPAGSFVGKVQGPNFSPPYQRIVDNSSDNRTMSLFDVQLTNGDITTKNALNREDQESHQIVIRTFSPVSLIVVVITVLDINDFTPKFFTPNNTFSIPESAPKTHNIALGSVRDEDFGENSTKTVEIISGNEDNTFYLKIKNSSNVDKILDLVVNTNHLDYEMKHIYNLVIRATDGGGKYRDLVITIHILDENDNEPIFNNSKYSVKVAENVTVNTKIIQVEATDSDSSQNNQITYSIDASSDPDGYFSIDPKTGWVRVNKPLDYERNTQFLLTLEARDNGITSQLGTAALDVIVENINEQAANISLVFRPQFRAGHVLEDTPVGTSIADITIDDPDNDVSRTVEVKLYGHKGHFIIREDQEQDNKLVLVIFDDLDHENESEYKMTLDVTDVGTPPLSANTAFTIVVDDVNDNPPVFKEDRYTASIEETAEVGTEVIKVSADDLDTGENSRITYHLQDSSSHLGWFTVDPLTGVVSTRASMDCEHNAEPVLVIVATDGGDPPKMATAQVTISVRDVNNKEPEFDTSFYSIKISEDRRVGDCILAVSAIDPECGSNSPVTYKMARMLAPLQEFRVDNTTGEICVRIQLDYERASAYEFQVEALDSDGLSSQAVVQVEVTDVNDNRPKFEPSLYSINLVAESPAGPVVTVQARDRDSGVFGTVTYSIISGNDRNLFSVDSGTGAVSLDEPLPVGIQDIQLQIRATDGGGLTSDTPAEVKVSVISDGVHPPVFSPTMFNFTLSENAQPNDLVGIVQATLDESGGDALSEIQYTSIFQTADWFRIDQLTGAIYTKSVVDREEHPFVVLSVQAQARFPPIYAMAQVNVTILDINDNQPMFPATSMLELEVREDEAVDSVLYEARAYDLDLGRNGQIKYHLENDPSGLFSIGTDSGKLKLDSSLDYEHHKDYELLIVAKDMGLTSLSNTMTLTINVKDVNDNTPHFIDDPPYMFNVPENVEIGHSVGTVIATDEDYEHNGRISYSFIENRYENVFGISPKEGVIWTKDVLDRELHDVYEMKVMAMDHGTTIQLSSTTSVTIVVTDDNDNKPEFSREEYRFAIQENLPKNRLVGQVTATDLDIGPNGRLQYGFASPQTNFSIDRNSGVIHTRVSLDREQFAKHLLTVYVSDGGLEPQTAQVKVTVLDTNDNDPVFQRQGPFSPSVLENLPKGTEVIQLVAFDPDEGDNGLVTYFFDPGRSQASALENFEIHPRSGKVTTKEVLDFDSTTSYQMRVVAQDNGQEPWQTSQLLTISVLNANDQDPLYNAQQVTFDCVENVSVGTVVGQVVANDGESGANGNYHYYLVGGNVFSSFTVRRTDGLITTVREVDYEESSFHMLNIQAKHRNAATPRTSNITVTINVLDVNDNAPSFEQDSVIMLTVAENTKRTQSIHQFIATDRDSDVNGTVQYSIKMYAGQDKGLGPYFSIDPFTGHLNVDGIIDYEQVHVISVIVQATDQCPYPNLALHSTITTLISVTDINDNSPEFESADTLNVSEDEPQGYLVLVVVAVDADSNEDGSGNNRVRYRIVDGNQEGKFLLGDLTGYLTLSDLLDYEVRSTYILNISAEDSGTPSRISFQQLTIAVTDVNDNAPVFERAVYEASVYENMNAQTPVVTIQASDADIGANGDLRYSIPNGIAEDRFAVDPTSGVVTTRARLDREEKDAYVVTVYVQDSAYPIHYSSCTIEITVKDRNDHEPQFKDDALTIQVPENRAQMAILTLVASDHDRDDNARITYSITDGNTDDKFCIDPAEGHLSCSALDRETVGIYRLTILARDNGDQPKSATATVTVTVLDENDNSPQFSKQVYKGSIAEDIGQGVVVVKVNASDPDQDSNGRVMYSLSNDTDGFFEIDSVTGNVITSGVFDREKIPFYSFLIMASDNGVTGPRNSTARVDIEVTDVNDNAPQFTMVPYTSSLSLSKGRDSVILTVNATDSDAGSNGTVTYSLMADDGYPNSLQFFHIDIMSGTLYTKQSLLTAAGHHSLLVVATDSAISPDDRFSSTGVIEITVGSGSVQRFHFKESEYSADIDENLADRSPITQVEAVYDNKVNSEPSTRYSFASGNENSAFSINSVSGQVTVGDSRFLDYDTKTKHRLTVKAVDNTNHAYVTLRVDLRDLNDNTPKFSQSRYVSSVWENNLPETFVTQVFARDADSGLNGVIDYFIVDGNGEDNFEIRLSDTGLVQTHIDAAPLDREARPGGYSLIIEARDRGFPTQSSSCTLVINIVDDNDSPPLLPKISRNVSENRDVGYMVAMATANDVDLNPILVYDFTTDGNLDKSFSIDRSTGRLTLARRLDHEKKSHYAVGIQVMDGVPDHTRSEWMDIYVTDENDNAPQFSQQSYEVALPEQTGPQRSVMTVLAEDADSGRNAEVTYSMAASPVDSFYIHPKTGTISTNRTISFTSGESIIQLVVIARDAGTPALSSLVAVHIQITDVNKHAPRFLKPSGYEAWLSETAPQNQMVLQVSAVDDDSSHRDMVHYSLVGSHKELFHIQQRTGLILYNGGVDFEKKQRYDLFAVATDRGTPPKNTTVPVAIFVQDENDNDPKFLLEHYAVTLPEDYPALQEFIRVNASDMDSGLNGELKYYITSGNSEGKFLNPRHEGGLVIMQGMQLDYESHISHRLILRVVDCSRCNVTSPRRSAFVTVDITVTDVNEFKPRFPVKHYLESIAENSPSGTVVFRAHANDADAGDAGIVTYSLMNELDHSKFTISKVTGDVSTLEVFDFEKRNTPHLYNITISATDSGGNYDMASVTIRVVDVDEFAPELTATEYEFEVPGSAKAGDFIGQVSAKDLDGGEAGNLVFGFLDHNGYFYIHPRSGNISLAVTLHENPPSPHVERSRRRRALTTDNVELTIVVGTGKPGSKNDTAKCSIAIDRTCQGCVAPQQKLHADEGMDGGVLAGIIVACIIVICITVGIIIFCAYKRRSPRKSVPNYSSDSTLDLEPPPTLPHDRGYHDVIRISRPPLNNHMASDISDQSHNSASSGRGSAEAEDDDEEISRINSNSFLHSSQAFRQKAMPDSGIQHDDDTLSEPTATTHQEYLANLGIDSAKIGKTKSSSKQLGRSAESMHQFSDEGGGEGGVDTDFEKMTDLETDEEVATLEARTHAMSFHEPDTHNVGSLSNVVNSEEVNSGSYNWDYLIDWGPQYQPLAHVFSEIAKLKDESITPKKQPVKTVPQRQFSSSLKPQVRTDPPPIITNAPPMSVSLAPVQASTNQNGDIIDFVPHQSPPVPVRRNHVPHHPQQQAQQHHQQQHNHQHHNHHLHHHHHHHPMQHQQPNGRASHGPVSQPPPTFNSIYQPPLPPLPPPNYTPGIYPQFSPQVPSRYPPQHPEVAKHRHHLPPPNHPPPQPPTQQQSISGSRSQPNSGHASTMNTSLPSLPRSPISYESSLTSAAMTPSLTPSLSPLATRSPSISPVVSSGQTTPGKAVKRSTHSVSSNSEREFTI